LSTAAPDAGRTPAHPLPRTDLQLAPAVERGEPCTYVRDPLRRSFYRLGDTAVRAVRLMDGQRDAAMIAAALSSELDVQVPTAAVEALIRDLDRQGFLQNGAPPTPAPRVRGGPLFLVIPLVDPERALQALAPLWRALVSRPVAVAIALLIAAGVGVHLHWWRAGWPVATGELGPRELLAFYLVVSAAIVLHELGHAVTLKAMGGEVHELGVLLLYLQPCFYCNTSDAYLLPRRQRLWVSFAGLYVELGAWGAASLLAWALGPGQGAGRIALLVTTVIGLKALLFNLNPLIKLDGYYLLVDALELPNLRQRAFAHLARTLGFGRRDDEKPPRDRREAWLLLGYAALALLFLLGLFGVLALRLLDGIQGGEWSASALFLAVACGFLLLRGVRFVWRRVGRRDP
jgi:putative peptide zinc metalloprotease protein